MHSTSRGDGALVASLQADAHGGRAMPGLTACAVQRALQGSRFFGGLMAELRIWPGQGRYAGHAGCCVWQITGTYIQLGGALCCVCAAREILAWQHELELVLVAFSLGSALHCRANQSSSNPSQSHRMHMHCPGHRATMAGEEVKDINTLKHLRESKRGKFTLEDGSEGSEDTSVKMCTGVEAAI